MNSNVCWSLTWKTENDSEDTVTKLSSHKQTKFAWTNEVQTFQKERFKELTYVTVFTFIDER